MAAVAESIMTNQVYGICRNGAASETSQSSADWLRDAPRGTGTRLVSYGCL